MKPLIENLKFTLIALLIFGVGIALCELGTQTSTPSIIQAGLYVLVIAGLVIFTDIIVSMVAAVYRSFIHSHE
ncbi:hypothetical protein YA0002_24410 [Pseudomonas cichorii]|uniref:hypothetical protein n=1 Tax=Pseudomonas cichorii TaxID=36746 RepID=UPI0018E5FBFA|nr:hypothetical protein [Pseudomonas cichorii]MBI6855911.1 hypothetical protein [Pseudomonas cichorii]